MNQAIKLLPLFAAAIVLPGMAINAHAQDTTQPEQVREHHRGQRLNKLNLTPEQKARMKQMRQESRAEIEQILTPEQKAKLQAMKAKKKGMRKGWKELNLTAEQEAKIKALRASKKGKFEAILTPAQKAELAKMKANRKNFQPGK
jgi:Spy/CpxP family protein refolding chaperone